MIVTWIFFLISFSLAGTHFPSKIFTTFEDKILSGDINALESLIETNSNLIKSPSARRYRHGGFMLAVQQDRAPVVEFLLKNGNVNAAANENEAIRLASENGLTDIVQLLLERPEVNPGALNNEALIDATRNGHTDIVRLLLAHPKLNPTSGRSHAVFLATSNNHADIVKLFLHDGRFNAALYQSHTLDRAAQFGNIDFVRYLLSYPYFSRIAPEVVMKGDLLTIKTLVEAGYKFDQNTFDITFERARLRWEVDLLEYLETLKETPKLPERPLIAMTEQCAICLSDENLLEGFMTLCNHQFHVECLQKWIARHNSCPMCRSSII